MTPPRRVCAVGLDAAEWTLIEPMLESGELPHLAALKRRSAFARLEDPVDYRTGLVWEQFLTGRTAASNQRWAAVEFDPASYGTWQEGARPSAPFFSADPVETIALDVPYFSLASAMPGAQVTNWGGHDPAYPPASNPPELFGEIEAEFGPHPASANDYEVLWYRATDMDALADALVVGARRRVDIGLWLQRRFPDWRLFLSVQSETHSANEQFWHGVDDTHPVAPISGTAAGHRLREVYRAADDAVGRYVAAADDDTTLVVFSMHGAGTNEGDTQSMVLLPELLHRLHGKAPLLTTPELDGWRAAGSQPLVPSADESWATHMRRVYYPEANSDRSLRSKVRDIVPPRIRDAIRAARRRATKPDPTIPIGVLGIPMPERTHSTPAQIGVPRLGVDWQVACRYRDAWPTMRYFALPTYYDGRVRLNIKGRERDGIVDPGDYEQVCDEVEAAVRACRNARTGKEVVARVRRLRADDPFAPGGPDADLELVFAEVTDAWVHPDAGALGPVPFRRTGGHSPRGFAMIHGPGITPGDLGTHDAIDVPATIDALLHGGVPSAPDLDGSPLLVC